MSLANFVLWFAIGFAPWLTFEIGWRMGKRRGYSQAELEFENARLEMYAANRKRVNDIVAHSNRVTAIVLRPPTHERGQA